MNWVPWRPFQNEWNRRYIPSRGLLYSFLVHEVAFFACFSYGLIALPKAVLNTPEQEIHDAELVYLPSVGGGDEGGEQGARSKEGEGPTEDSAAAKKGITYRGPQHIKSNPPNPDNHLQTVLQPALVVAPKLTFAMQMPNLVKIAPPKPVEVIEAKPNAPKVVAPPVPVLVAKTDPQLIATPLRSEIDHLLPTPPLQAAEKPPVVPIPVVPESSKAVRPAPPVLTADASISDQSIAVLNAIQITAKPTILPPGEKLGSFEVSPNGGATPSASTNLGPGTPGGTSTGTATAGGGKSDKGGVTGGVGKGEGKTGTGAGKHGTGMGSSSPNGGAGKGTGIGKGVTGRGAGFGGNGHGNGSGGTKGGGSGNGNGIGTGAGTGDGSGPFSDLEVIGGVGSGMQGAGPKPAVKAAIPRGYDFNIVASGGSGGGLRDFGVFHNEAVYTVYMDVSDVIPGSRSWILQYADYAPARTAEISLDAPVPAQSLLEPPIAITREVAPAAAAPTTGIMTVVTGLISAEGKFQGGRVLQAASAERGQQWLTTLDRWKFQPAGKNGRPAVVRIILGIPES